MISAEQHERERVIAERLKAPRAMAAYYAGRCACGAMWEPGGIIFKSPFPRGPRAVCLDCGLRQRELETPEAEASARRVGGR